MTLSEIMVSLRKTGTSESPLRLSKSHLNFDLSQYVKIIRFLHIILKSSGFAEIPRSDNTYVVPVCHVSELGVATSMIFEWTMTNWIYMN